MSFMKPDYDTLVGSIYDCAANPELWPDTLDKIRDRVSGAYAMIGYSDFSILGMRSAPATVNLSSPWDMKWFDRIIEYLPTIPKIESLMRAGIDNPWVLSEHLSDHEYEKSPFYLEWANPQGLGDSIQTMVIDRNSVRGFLVLAADRHRPKFAETERTFANLLAPHVRRAIMINDIVDKGNLAMAIYRKVLDQLSTAVFVVGAGQRLVFTNAAGDTLLSDGNFLTTAASTLQAHRTAGLPAAFEDALSRAAKGDAAIGISGIGIPLIGKNGERAAAYVLPIAGKDLRGTIGQGHCAVFVARRDEQQPMALELLRTMFDLTVMEARVAMLLAQGQGPQAIADGLKISVNTVRSHLKHAYAKTNTTDQTTLSALVHAILPPVNNN